MRPEKSPSILPEAEGQTGQDYASPLKAAMFFIHQMGIEGGKDVNVNENVF